MVDGVQPYPVLETRVDPRASVFQENARQMQALLERLSAALADSRRGGGEKYVARHREAGKLLPRERIELLLDRDSHFLELCPIAGYEMSGETTGGGVIGGVGVVSGVECLITASEATAKGGAVTPI